MRLFSNIKMRSMMSIQQFIVNTKEKVVSEMVYNEISKTTVALLTIKQTVKVILINPKSKCRLRISHRQ